MSVVSIASDSNAISLPKRHEQPDTGQEWQRQLEAELGQHSVCRAIPLGERRTQLDNSMVKQAGAEHPHDAMVEYVPRTKSGQTVRAADHFWHGETAGQAGSLVAGKVDEAANQNLAARSGREEYETKQTISPCRESLEQGVKTALQGWLKLSKITIFPSEDGMRVWVRDARMGEPEAERLGRSLARYVGERGGQLAMLTVNGMVVFRHRAMTDESL